MARQHPIFILLAFALGVAFGMWDMTLKFPNPVNPFKVALQEDSQAEQGTNLTNPLLDCADLPTAISENGVEKLHDDLKNYIDAETSNGQLLNASVYYRDLNNGPWTLVNPTDKYSPASLLKVPLAVSLYEDAELNPALLDKKITYEPDPSTASEVQPYTPEENVVAGKTYTVRDLIRIMLQDSSNEAAVELTKQTKFNEITDVYQNLGLPVPVAGQDYAVTVREYSSFLRILYNATYLTRTNSETVLALLTKTTYKDGIVAGIPAGTTVAHKFGSRGLDDGTVQMSDCGIVYANRSPYLLCVMTHGSDFNTLSKVIAHISALTYQYAASS